jgi:16S rRNA (guanine966-N2)-methyltransferase
LAHTGRSGKRSQAPPGRVRIVAGKWRGRFLPVDDAPGLRPTSERIRETLFNWLAPVIEGTHCLDLFAGTGVLGLEALSRGAATATFVERSPKVAATLKRSIATLGADDAMLHVGDALAWLGQAPPRRYDVVFLDPPYSLESLPDLCRLLAEKKWLAAGAGIYMEHDRKVSRPDLPGGFTVVREKTAGTVRYLLAETRDSNEV